MTDFTCQTHESDGTAVVTARGELDIATAGQMISAATPWLLRGSRVVLDCTGITFMDSRGLQAMLELRRIAVETGSRFSLASVPRAVSRILAVAGVDRFFVVEQLHAV